MFYNRCVVSTHDYLPASQHYISSLSLWFIEPIFLQKLAVIQQECLGNLVKRKVDATRNLPRVFQLCGVSYINEQNSEHEYGCQKTINVLMNLLVRLKRHGKSLKRYIFGIYKEVLADIIGDNTASLVLRDMMRTIDHKHVLPTFS